MSKRKAALDELATSRERERAFTGFASLAIIPIVFGVLGAYSGELRASHGTTAVVVVWGLVALVTGVFAVRLNPTGQSLLSLIVENENLEAKVLELDARGAEQQVAINRLAFEAGYAASARAAILSYANLSEAQSSIESRADLGGALDNLAVPLVFESEELFGIGPSEAWNFAIYLYSAEQRILEPVWRKKAVSHPSTSQGLGRNWQPGEGHVGKAFVDQRPIITADATDPVAAEFSTVPPGAERVHDGAYVSFASVPIGPILAQDNRPYGVIVGTSDRAGRFNRSNAGILVQIAGAIASLLITGGLDIDHLSKPIARGSNPDQTRDENGQEQ